MAKDEHMVALRERLRTALASTSRYDATSLARSLGRSPDYVRDFLAGRKGSIGIAEIAKAEQLLGIPVGQLMFSKGGTVEYNEDLQAFMKTYESSLLEVPYAGRAEIGTYRMLDDDPKDLIEPMRLDVGVGYLEFPHMIFKVADNSMDALSPRAIFKGDYAVCADLSGSGYSVKMGDVVVLERIMKEQRLRELSLRQAELRPDSIAYHCRSSDLKHKAVVVGGKPVADDDIMVRPIARVRMILGRLG